MNLKSRNKVQVSFNMSSLTDIIFLLLIFFMLTSTLVSVNALNLILPSSDSKTVDKQSISISIDKNLVYYVDKKNVTLAEMKTLIRQKMKEIEKPTVVLNAEQSVPIENVVQVMSIGYELKVDMILATQPKK